MRRHSRRAGSAGAEGRARHHRRHHLQPEDIVAPSRRQRRLCADRSATTASPDSAKAYHGRLKEGLCPFHGAATRNLPHYFGWRRTLEALGHPDQPGQSLSRAVGLGAHQQLMQ